MRTSAHYLILMLLTSWLTTSCDRQKTADDDTLPMVVMQMRKSSRLYTTEYKVHKIVTFDDVVHLRGQMFSKSYSVALPLGDRKVAIPMNATLKAYIDFSNFSEDAVRRRDDGTVVVTLPDPKIILTDSKIDQEGIREYLSLTRSHFTDKELADFELQGRDAIIDHIPQMGIVEGARESAARQIIPLLVSMGFREQDVVVEFRQNLHENSIRTLMDANGLER